MNALQTNSYFVWAINRSQLALDVEIAAKQKEPCDSKLNEKKTNILNKYRELVRASFIKKSYEEAAKKISHAICITIEGNTVIMTS